MQISTADLTKLKSDDVGTFAIMALQSETTAVLLGEGDVQVTATLDAVKEGETPVITAPGTKVYFSADGVVFQTHAPKYSAPKAKAAQGSVTMRQQG
jgi:hypothetical protein